MVAFSRLISNLPTEILAIIFQEATDLQVSPLELTFWLLTNDPAHSDAFGWARGPRPGGSPWNIAQVCRLWRAIALGLPELWSDVFLHVRPHCTPPVATPEGSAVVTHTRVRHVQSDALRDILMRSHPTPLRVRLKTTFATPAVPEVNSALRLISSHQHRIELLDIRLPNTIPLPSMSLPNVRHLSLREEYTVDDDPVHLLLSVGRMSMPAVNRIDYFGHTLVKYTIRTSNMPWEQITVLNLRLAWIAWQSILHLLARTTQVETLSISSNGISQIGIHDRQPPTSIILLPSLVSISFYLFPSDIICVLGTIQTPGLRVLDLRGLPYGHPSMIQPPNEVVLQALDNVARAHANLATLRLVDIHLSRIHIHALLSSLDHLEHLAIRCPFDESAVSFQSFPDLTGILHDWTATSLSPLLQSLSLMSSSWDYAPQGTLLQLVRNRCQPDDAARLGVRPLRHLHITRRLCPAHGRMYERDEIDIQSLSLPFTSVVWRDMDFDGKSPALRCCTYCHAGIADSIPPPPHHTW